MAQVEGTGHQSYQVREPAVTYCANRWEPPAIGGDPKDDEYAPLVPPALGEPRRKVEWDERLVPKLDRVHINYTEPWELWALSAIRTREVIVTTRSDSIGGASWRCLSALTGRMVKTPSWLHGLDWRGSVSETIRLEGSKQLQE